MRAARFFFSIFAFMLFFAALCLAQSSDTGLPPFGSFHGSNFDLVALNSRNLHVEIPLWSLPQRAAPNTGLRLVYDMPTWQVNKSNPTPTTTQWTVGPVSGEKVYWNVFHDPVGAAGTNHDTIQASCIWTDPLSGDKVPVQYFVHTNYVMTDTHGTKHFFNLRHSTARNPPCDVPPAPDVNSGYALDGSGYKAIITSDQNHPTIQLAQDIGQFNGNLGNELSTGGSTTLQTDQNGVLISRIDTVLDSDGHQQQFRIDYAAVPNFTSFCPLLPFQPLPSGTTCVESSFPLNLPQKLTLPNNKFYQFTWSIDGNADLLRIDLPTGGYISYTYETKLSVAPFQQGGIKQYKVRRRVTSRTLSDGVLPPQTWNYLPGGTVRDPLQNEEVHTFGAPAGGADDGVNYELQVDYYQGTAASGTLLRTIKKDYLAETDLGVGPEGVAHGTINARLIRTTTILGDAAQTQTKTETDYEMFTDTSGGPVTFLNPVEQREYAFGAGSPGATPLRRTVYTYLHTGNQNYLSRNIVHRVLSTTVYDGSGNQVAQTLNEYDNYSHPGQPMAPSNAIQHDDSNFNIGFVYRGNLTAVSHWRNTDGAMLTTTNQYDDAGNLLSTIDPLGHKTSYDYTDSWGNASCAPVGQAKVFATSITNALNQPPITKKHNSCTATLASVTEQNARTTVYSYDLMNRLGSASYPDGGNTTNAYDDNQRLVTSSTLITLPGSRIYSRKHYDQLGRVVQTELCEDGTAACVTSVKTDTAYDEVGQVKTVWNPYRTSSDPGPTNGFTRTDYDALGRAMQITKQDGSFSTISYDANCTTATDEAGKKRKSCADALGRLTQVFEDPLGLNYETDYSYDTLSNLTSVVQKGGAIDSAQWRIRTFVYNSISQLLSATNPESGKISYSYDDAGNVHTKASPAPNQTITTGSAGTGAVTVGGRQNCRQGCDLGTVSITVSGFTATTNYGQTSTSTTIATSLTSLLNVPSSPVTATSSANVVSLISKATGVASNYPLSATSHSSVLLDPFFTATASGSTLAGGTDPPTVTLTYCYDDLNRLTDKAYSAQPCPLPPGTASASYSYDQSSFNGLAITNGIGRRTGMTDQAGAEAWSYDEMGRTVADRRTTASISNSTLYSYNKNGSTSSMQYSSGTIISYGYNAAGQPINAIDALNVSYASSALYTPAGALASLTSVGGLTSSFIYNTRLQPCRTFVTTGTMVPTNCPDSPIGNIMDLSYNFSLGAGDNGNVTQITNNRESTRTQSFVYDSLNRIATAQTASTSGTYCFGETFSIDAWGNLTSIGGLTNYAGCTQESLSAQASVQNRLNTNLWDAAGNALITGYSYDAENHLITAGGVIYTYDGDGKRVQKSGGKIYWYGMGTDALDETDLAGSFTNPSFNEYIFFGGKRIARRDGSNNIFNYFADHLGTSRVIVLAGQTTPCYDADFYPYGGERPPVVNNCSQNYKFTGKERDIETGLDYFGARYNGSSLGRFMTADPFNPFVLPHEKFLAWISNPQRWNKFAYALNNPVTLFDPDGLNACGTNDDANCQVTITFADRTKDEHGNYNDQWSNKKGNKDFNATATVKVNGKTVGTFLARTTPSNGSKFATIANGTYDAIATKHNGQDAIRLLPTTHIPTSGPNPSRSDGASFATGILIHIAGRTSEAEPLGHTGMVNHGPLAGHGVSEGCQLICTPEYGQFLHATGMVPGDGSAPQNTFTVNVNASANGPTSATSSPSFFQKLVSITLSGFMGPL